MKKNILTLGLFLGLSSALEAADRIGVASIIPSLSSDEVSIPLTYSAGFSSGYDSNVSGMQSIWLGKKYKSFYVRPNVYIKHANYSDARTKSNFSLNLGAYYYFEKAPTTRDWYSDSSFAYFLTHNLNSRLSLTSSNSVAYRLEPDYAQGLSSSRMNGSYWTISSTDALNYKWSTRFSTSTTAGFSWIKYDNFDYENRYSYNIGESFFYILTPRLTWSLKYSYNRTERQEGLNSQSNFLSTGGSFAVSSLASLNFNAGAQVKTVDSQAVGTKVYPTFDIGYNQRMSEDWSFSLFSRLSNEDMGTYSGKNANYGSNMTLRAGFNTSYSITPLWNVRLGVDEVFSQYSQATGSGMSDREENTTCLSWGTSYKLSSTWLASLTLSYTLGNVSYKKTEVNGNYDRYNISAQLTYQF